MSVAKHIIAMSGYSWSYEENFPHSTLHIPSWAGFQMFKLSMYDNRLRIFDLVPKKCSPSEHSRTINARSKLLDASNKGYMPPDSVCDGLFEDTYSYGPVGYQSFERFLADSETWPGLLFEDDWFVTQVLIHLMMSRRVEHGTLCRLAGIVEHLVARGASGSVEILRGLDTRTLLHVACKIKVAPEPYDETHLNPSCHDMQGCDSAPVGCIQNWKRQRWSSWQQEYYNLRRESLQRIIKALLKGSNVFQRDKSGKTAWRLASKSTIMLHTWVEFDQARRDLATKRRAEYLQRRVQRTRDLRKKPVFREQILGDCETCARHSRYFSSWLQKRQK
ncbi:hypothetical protein K456DRAFT_1912486 [Colletotrichum gloeosporioides 23]|nr:hypothetical protein K456DRAFT_1912486 [Colletotrichum gloeosporioides 23]